MRILLLTEFFYDFSTFRLTLESLARVYCARGHRVETAGQRGPSALRANPVRASWGRASRIGKSRHELRALVSAADVVHLHTAGSWTPYLSAIAAACADKPLVVTFQDWDNPDLRSNDAAARRSWAMLLRSAAVTAVSRGIAKRLGQALPSVAARTRPVPNGVDAIFLRRRARTSSAQRRPFILCPARLSAYKGIDVALLAWKDAGPALAGVDLVFCGPDHARGRFQRLARLLGLGSRTRFLGAVGRARIRELMGSCLFAVLPSRHESFGIVALEAMASGKAVLATRTDGPSDVVSHRSTGLLVAPGRPDALRDGLLRLGKDAGLRGRLGRAGRKRAEAFRWENVADAYLPLYAAAGKR